MSLLNSKFRFCFRNGSKSRDSVPLRRPCFAASLVMAPVNGIALSSPFHNGTESHDSLPLRHSSSFVFLVVALSPRHSFRRSRIFLPFPYPFRRSQYAMSCAFPAYRAYSGDAVASALLHSFRRSRIFPPFPYSFRRSRLSVKNIDNFQKIRHLSYEFYTIKCF